MSLETTYDDVIDLAREAWRLDDIHLWERTHNPGVVNWAINYTHRPATMAEVLPIIRTTDNPNEGLHNTIENIPVRDAYVDWPISWVFHKLRAERDYAIPTHEELWAYIQNEGRAIWFDPMCEQTLNRVAGELNDEVLMAIYARAMKAWQSCIRELHMIAMLHSWGIPAHFHPVADARMFADAWWDHHIFALHVRNVVYERKKRPEDIYPGTFQIHHFDVKGKPWEPVWLVNATQLKQAVA